MNALTPFTINIDPSVSADLTRRLQQTRWPNELDNAHWEAGTSESYLQELCRYWQSGFDWPKQQAHLNSFPQYKTTINGVGIHFIYQKGEGKTSVPLLLTHGYPDSFVRFLKLIPLLTKADESGFCFDVIVPSIPGYGFSDIPTQAGMNPGRIADLFTELMTSVLGYPKFVAHGGDWGGIITEQIALHHADTLLGIHLTDVPFQHNYSSLTDASEAEQAYLAGVAQWGQVEGAFATIQTTKPQTLAYGLNDSPAGLAAWLVEKFKSWSDNDGNLETAFTKDELLTNITIYWVTQTVASAFRLYNELMKAMMQAMYNPSPNAKAGQRVEVPTAFSLFPKDYAQPPKAFANRFFNVQRWIELSAGGHFTAMEQPKLLADELRQFVSPMTSAH